MYNKAVFNFEKAPLARFIVGLSIDRKDVTLSSKGADTNLLIIQSVPPVSIKYSDPSNIPITTDPESKSLELYVSRSPILKEVDSDHARIEFSCQFFQADHLLVESLVTEIQADID